MGYIIQEFMCAGVVGSVYKFFIQALEGPLSEMKTKR